MRPRFVAASATRPLAASIALLAASLATAAPLPSDPSHAAGGSLPPRQSAGVPEDIHWDDRFGVGADTTVRAIAVAGDGSVYIGGLFTTAGGVPASRVAKWDGTRWSSLGSGMNGNVYALAVDEVGNVYAGGEFSTAGGVAAQKVARWDGTAWSALGSGIGLGGTVSALAVDPAGHLYAGGIFSTAGGVAASNVARWNGAVWSPLGAGANDWVRALAIDAAGNLFAGGNFTSAGGVAASRVARWNGASWSPVGPGVNSDVAALVVDAGGRVHAGGGFTLAGGIPANYVATWDGDSWSALGAGTNGVVLALAADALGRLLVCGSFTQAGSAAVDGFAVWNGSTWYASVPSLGASFAVAVAGGDVLVGGVEASRVNRVQGPSLTAAVPLGAAPDQPVYALALDGQGGAFVGGAFATIGAKSAANIAHWDGLKWASLGSGLNGPVRALVMDGNGSLYAGGLFTLAGGVAANNVARWNGTSWSPLGAGVNGEVDALTLDGSGNLYAGGYFNAAGGAPASRVARWNGTSWSALGTGMNGAVRGLDTDAGGSLYAIGSFSSAGGVAAANVARWDGSSWSALGSGLGSLGFAVALDASDHLYAGGIFSTAGGVTAQRIAKWDGATWSAVGASSFSTVQALAFDGSGNLYAGGTGWSHVRKWDGVGWSAIGSGTDNLISALAADGDGTLFVGGAFTKAGDRSSHRFGVWHTTDPVVTASAGPGGAIAPSGAIVVPRATSQAFTITPAGGHRVADVQVDGVSVGAVSGYTLVDVQGDQTIAASFEPDVCAPPGAGVVGWWTGDGDANDIAAGNHGAPQNGAAHASGRVDQGFLLDGVDDYVGGIGTPSTYSFVQNTGVFTLEAWVRLDDPHALGQRAIVANTTTSVENGFFFIWENTAGQRALRLGLMKGSDGVPVIDAVSPSQVVADAQWHHVAAVGNGASITFYVDGLPYPGSGTMGAFAAGSSSRTLEIGRTPYATPLAQWDGAIDELLIYRRALGAAEIEASYQAGASGSCRCGDADGDGHTPFHHATCSPVVDCDDDDPTIHPGASDATCNGIDNDCDGTIDEGVTTCVCVEHGPGLVGWWRAEGDATDATGNNDGSLMGLATYAGGSYGHVGQVFELPDGQGYVDLSDSPRFEFGSQMTLEAWIQTIDISNYRQILSKFGTSGNHAYQFGLAPNGALRGDLSGNGTSYQWFATPAGLLTAFAWHHVALTFDAGLATLYVNGEVAASATMSFSSLFTGGTTPLNIGRDPAGIQGFSGWIDEPAVYDRALTRAEIEAIYTSGGNGMCGLGTVAVSDAGVPARFALGPPRPNPCAGPMSLEFQLPARTAVRAEVLDVAGRRIATLVDRASMAAGTHRLTWTGRGSNGHRVAPGVYLIRLEADPASATRRIVVVN